MPQSRRTFITRGCAGAAAVLVAGCTGGDAEDAPAVSVDDQTGGGQTLTVSRVASEEPFRLEVSYGDETYETESYDAGTHEDLELELDPVLQETGTVDVALVSEDGEELATDSLEYEVENPVEANLAVSDQVAGGRWFTVEEVSASVDYYVHVVGGGNDVTSETFSGGSTQRGLEIRLAGIEGGAASVDVAVRDAETDQALVTETVQYEDVASLVVEHIGGEGESVTIDLATAATEYYVEIQYRTVTLTSETFEGGTVQEDLEFQLNPSVDKTRHLLFTVRDAETGEALTQVSRQYKVRGAVLDVGDQSGDGSTLSAQLAEADVDFYVAARYGTNESTSEEFPGGSVQRGVDVPLDPPIESDTEVDVAIHDANDHALLYDDTIQYSVE